MSTAPVPVTSAATLLNLTQQKAQDASAASNFLALLNVGGVSAASNTTIENPLLQDAAASGSADNQIQQNRRAPQPQATYAEASTPIVNTPPVKSSGLTTPPAPAASQQKNNASSASNTHNTSDDAHSRRSAQNDNANNQNNAAQDSKPLTAAAQSASGSNATSPAQANTAAQDSASLPTDPADQKLRSQLQDQLGNISQMLLSIIQALTAGAPAAAANTAAGSAPVAPTTGQPVTVSDNTAPVVPVTDPAAAATPADTATAATPVAAQPVALLQDMQALLQQMQQVLQAAPTGSDATSNQNNLQNLTSSLQSDMQQFTQLLTQQGSGGASLSSVLATATATQPGGTDLKSLLQNSIAQVGAQLQQMQSQNDAIYAAARAAFQAQLQAMTPLPAASQTAKTASDAVAATDAAATVSSAQQSQSVTTPAAPVNSQGTAQALQANAVAPVLAQGGMGDSTSDSGSDNQGQNQTLAQPVSGAGTAAPQQATGSANRTPFAAMLQQASQTPLPDQVAFHIKTALNDGSSKIHIQLDPAELGKMDIKLSIDADGKTGVVVTVDNKNTLTMLQNDARALTQALNDAGLKTDGSSLSFNLRGGQQDTGQGSGNGRSQAAQNYQKAQPDDEQDAIAVGSVISRSYVVNLAEGLDIKI